MKIDFSLHGCPVHTFYLITEVEHPPAQDQRTARQIFQQEVKQ